MRKQKTYSMTDFLFRLINLVSISTLVHRKKFWKMSDYNLNLICNIKESLCSASLKFGWFGALMRNIQPSTPLFKSAETSLVFKFLSQNKTTKKLSERKKKISSKKLPTGLSILQFTCPEERFGFKNYLISFQLREEIFWGFAQNIYGRTVKTAFYVSRWFCRETVLEKKNKHLIFFGFWTKKNSDFRKNLRKIFPFFSTKKLLFTSLKKLCASRKSEHVYSKMTVSVGKINLLR